jgi:hypothetical protein
MIFRGERLCALGLLVLAAALLLVPPAVADDGRGCRGSRVPEARGKKATERLRPLWKATLRRRRSTPSTTISTST